MRGLNARAMIVGFAGALVGLGVLYWAIDIDKTLNALSMANTEVLVLVVVGALCWLVAWGQALRTVLGVLGSTISPIQATAIFSGVQFANNITPFGQAGGEPISGFLISRATDREYETGLAAIASVDALNFIPSIILAICGLSYLATKATFAGKLQYAAFAVGALALVVPAGGYLGWRHRYRIERIAVSLLTPIVRTVRHTILRREPLGEAIIEERIGGFFSSIERVASTPRELALALGLSSLGWIAQGACLWLSLYALGHAVSPVVVFIAVPIGAVAGVTPLPGGLGGIEIVLVATISALVAINSAVILAAVLIHRGVIYVLPTVVGGGVVAIIANR